MNKVSFANRVTGIFVQKQAKSTVSTGVGTGKKGRAGWGGGGGEYCVDSVHRKKGCFRKTGKDLASLS